MKADDLIAYGMFGMISVFLILLIPIILAGVVLCIPFAIIGKIVELLFIEK